MNANGNEPAYPFFNDTCKPDVASGLTKREVFAKAAMQGLLSKLGLEWCPIDVAKWSVDMADAMLAELAKGVKP